MKSKKIIGITGSIATGKSTVTKIIREQGYSVIDADEIAHNLMKKGEQNYQNILDYFGEDILDINNEIDRKKLGKIVFKNPDKLKILNKLTHKNIFNKIKEMASKIDEEFVFLDIALLFELSTNEDFDIEFNQIWVVYTKLEDQLKRLMSRNNISQEDALSKIRSQLNIEEKVKLADVVIDNNSSLEELRKNVLERLRKLWKFWKDYLSYF